MKRSLTLLCFFILAAGRIYAQGIEFFHGTYEEALQKAQAEGKQIFVDVYTSWCGPCKMLGPVMEQLADRYDGKAVVAKVDVDEQQMLAIQYGVMSVPTVLFLKNGEEVGRLVGVQPAETYAQTLDKLL